MPKDVMLNLDDFERPNRPAPFSVTLGGRRYVLRDVQECDYRELIDGLQRFHRTGDAGPMIRRLVAEDDQEPFFHNRIEAFKLHALLTAYMAHYGIDPGKASASPRS